MAHKSPIVLTVFNDRNFKVVAWLFAIMSLIFVTLGDKPGLLFTALTLLLFAGWRSGLLRLSKVSGGELIFVIFPDGRVRLESNRGDSVEGRLDGTQWSTQSLAILRIVIGGRARSLVFLSTQQGIAGQFRRLNRMLRQDYRGVAGKSSVVDTESGFRA